MNLEDIAYTHAVAAAVKFYEDSPDGHKLLDTILQSFDRHFKNPPIRDFELLLRRNFTNEEMRCALFKPTEDQIMYYPMILHVTKNLSPGHVSELRTRSTVLSLIYLVHRQSWLFLEEFVMRGGLEEISNLTCDENLYYRGQAFEILLSITDCDSFDWFIPHNGNATAKMLHSRMLNLSQNTDFLAGLMENRKKSYPGGSLRALQLVAFWISWVRAMRTEKQVLYLSDRMLSELRLWATGCGEDISEHEVNLAKTIYKDFSYDQFHREDDNNTDESDLMDDNAVFWDALPAVPYGSPDNVAFTNDEKVLIFISGYEIPKPEEYSNDVIEVADVISTDVLTQEDAGYISKERSSIPIDAEECVIDLRNSQNSDFDSDHAGDVAVQELSISISLQNILKELQMKKAEGNELFKNCDFTGSLRIYENAIAILNPIIATNSTQVDEISSSSIGCKKDLKGLLTSLYYNTAAVYWKLLENEKEKEGSDWDVRTYVTLCESFCRSALLVDSTHSKSVYRLSDILMMEHRGSEALSVIEVHGALCPLSASLKGLRRKCLAAVMTAEHMDIRCTDKEIARVGMGEGGDLESVDVSGHMGEKEKVVADIAAVTVGGRAAKMLKALQARDAKQKGLCNGEKGSADRGHEKSVALNSNNCHAKEEDEKDNGDGFEGQVGPKALHNMIKSAAFDADCDRDLNITALSFSGITDTRIAENLNGKKEESRSTSILNPTKSSPKQSKIGLKKKEIVKEEESAKKKKCISADTLEVYSNLKKQSLRFHKCYVMSCEIANRCTATAQNGTKNSCSSRSNGGLEPDRVGDVGGSVCCRENDRLEELYAEMDTRIQCAMELLLKIWEEGSTLKKISTTTIEEEMLHLLLTIIVKCSISIPDNTGRTHSNLNLASKLVRQLIIVERFRTTFHLTLHGNENLKISLTEAFEKISQFHQNGENRIQVDEDFSLRKGSNEKTKRVDTLKSIESIAELMTSLK